MSWPRLIFAALQWFWMLCGIFCLVLSVCIIARRQALAEITDYLDGLARRRFAAWVPPVLFGMVIPVVLCLFKLAQYGLYQLPYDTIILGNVAWNFIHGYGLVASPFADRNYLAVHFAFASTLLSPLLWLRADVLTLLLSETLLVGSSLWAVYLLARLHFKPALPAVCLALLAFSNPLFFHSVASIVNNTQLALPFFLWGAYCWESRRIKAAVLMALLFLTTREQAPLLFIGLGLMLYLGGDPRRFWGIALSAAAMTLCLAEMALIARAQKSWPHHFNMWELFNTNLGSTGAQVLHNALVRPWVFARELIFPPGKLLIPLRIFFSFAFLPFLSGLSLLPALAMWAPQQLGRSGEWLTLTGHQAALIAGPLMWAAIYGFRRFYQDTAVTARRLGVAGILAVCAFSFFNTKLLPGPESLIMDTWLDSAPQVLKKIPPRAKVWCDEYLAADLSMRRYLRILPYDPEDYCFLDNLFVPDRVILSRRWMALCRHEMLVRIMGFLRERKFYPVFKDDNFIILANPGTAADDSEPAILVRLPEKF